jgi:hypothetical protein
LPEVSKSIVQDLRLLGYREPEGLIGTDPEADYISLAQAHWRQGAMYARLRHEHTRPKTQSAFDDLVDLEGLTNYLLVRSSGIALATSETGVCHDEF